MSCLIVSRPFRNAFTLQDVPINISDRISCHYVICVVVQAIPVWLFNGNEYPYYEVEFGEGTPCDLKEGTTRSVSVRYICDLNSHSTGTVGRGGGLSVDAGGM